MSKSRPICHRRSPPTNSIHPAHLVSGIVRSRRDGVGVRAPVPPVPAAAAASVAAAAAGMWLVVHGPAAAAAAAAPGGCARHPRSFEPPGHFVNYLPRGLEKKRGHLGRAEGRERELLFKVPFLLLHLRSQRSPVLFSFSFPSLDRRSGEE